MKFKREKKTKQFISNFKWQSLKFSFFTLFLFVFFFSSRFVCRKINDLRYTMLKIILYRWKNLDDAQAEWQMVNQSPFTIHLMRKMPMQKRPHCRPNIQHPASKFNKFQFVLWLLQWWIYSLQFWMPRKTKDSSWFMHEQPN